MTITSYTLVHGAHAYMFQILDLTFKSGVFGSDEDGHFSVAYLKIELSRHGAYYTHVFVAPSVLLALVTLLIFLVPPESSERLSMGEYVRTHWYVYYEYVRVYGCLICRHEWLRCLSY